MSASGSRPKVNLRSTAVKRIMQEASELADPTEDDFIAAPLETDIFEWHCTMRGVAGSEYDGGLYHLRIILPPTYPMSAPDIILLTPNGRFELGKKICIDGLTSFHAGSWQPAWGVRTAVLGLRSFWMQGGEALSAIGALDYSKVERKRLAKASHEWECPQCGKMKDQIPPAPLTRTSEPADKSEIEITSSEQADTETAGTPSDVGDVESPSTLTTATTVTTVESRSSTVSSTHPEPEATLPSSSMESADPAVGAEAVPAVSDNVPTVHITAPIRPEVAPPLSPPPKWIDGLIIAGVAILVMLLYRKISTPSNLIETVSL